MFEEKNEVRTPLRNGASVAYLTMSVLSIAAQSFVVVGEKAWDGPATIAVEYRERRGDPNLIVLPSRSVIGLSRWPGPVCRNDPEL
jgi:hypothetical protein